MIFWRNICMASARILILNGPECSPGGGALQPDQSSTNTDVRLQSIEDACASACKAAHLDLEFLQFDKLQTLFQAIVDERESIDAYIISPLQLAVEANSEFALNKSSSAIISQIDKPLIEVHLGNVFSHHANTTAKILNLANANMGLICGLGVRGYLLAITAVAHQLKHKTP